MKNNNCNVLTGVDTASKNGIQIDANQLLAASFHIHFGDATAVGTVKVQASNEIPPARNMPQDFTVANWVDIPSASATITAGGDALITINPLCYRWLRVVYTRTSGGSTTIDVLMNAQSV